MVLEEWSRRKGTRGKCWQRYCRRKKSFSLSLSFLLSSTTLHAALKLWTGWCGHSSLDPLLCKHCFRRPVADLYPHGNDYEGEEGRGWAGLCVMAKCDWVHNTLEACRLLLSVLWARQKSWSVKRLLHVTIPLVFCEWRNSSVCKFYLKKRTDIDKVDFIFLKIIYSILSFEFCLPGWWLSLSGVGYVCEYKYQYTNIYQISCVFSPTRAKKNEVWSALSSLSRRIAMIYVSTTKTQYPESHKRFLTVATTNNINLLKQMQIQPSINME